LMGVRLTLPEVEFQLNLLRSPQLLRNGNVLSADRARNRNVTQKTWRKRNG
jgi:hypothetical protein